MRRKGVISQSIETRRSAEDASMETSTEKTDLGASVEEGQELPDLQAENLSAQILRLAHQAEGREEAAADNTPLQLFGVLVGSIRRKLGLRLEDAARRAGLPADLVAAIELGIAPFDQVVEALKPLGDALGHRYAALSRALADLTLK